jgi:hypothetical protein
MQEPDGWDLLRSVPFVGSYVPENTNLEITFATRTGIGIIIASESTICLGQKFDHVFGNQQYQGILPLKRLEANHYECLVDAVKPI